MNTSSILAACVLAFGGLTATLAQAQDFPTMPVRILTPFPAGAGPEAVVRVLAEKLQKKWGKPVIVENKPGANGFLAIDAFRRGATDGHDLIQLDLRELVSEPLLAVAARHVRLAPDCRDLAPCTRDGMAEVLPVDEIPNDTLARDLFCRALILAQGFAALIKRVALSILKRLCIGLIAHPCRATRRNQEIVPDRAHHGVEVGFVGKRDKATLADFRDGARYRVFVLEATRDVRVRHLRIDRRLKR